MKPKKIGKSIICWILERQVTSIRKKYDFKIIAVVGSVGKTSTKLAIAKLLSTKEKVMFQDGNYNDQLTVPLIVFNKSEPNIYNVFAWLKIFLGNKRTIKNGYPYNVVILELGTDAPGQLKYFKYLRPDILVLSAIADEHMQYFDDLDAVAKEELTPIKFSNLVLVNIDDTPARYLPNKEFLSYGLSPKANYYLSGRQQDKLKGQNITIDVPDKMTIESEIFLLGAQGAKAALAAASVAQLLGWSSSDIESGLKTLTSVPGRMQILSGINGSVLIDDTYNASPLAVKAALDVLYDQKAETRVAILGAMNELGPVSQSAHKEIGNYCDPKKLDLVVTIGSEAEKFLAPAAKNSGCNVVSFLSPYRAGQYVKEHLKPNSIVLAKGSQNAVFAEEAVKLLLNKSSDENKLVRQSNYWLNIKKKQFQI